MLIKKNINEWLSYVDSIIPDSGTEWKQKLENEVKFDLSIPKIVEKNPNGKQPIIDELFNKLATAIENDVDEHLIKGYCQWILINQSYQKIWEDLTIS